MKLISTFCTLALLIICTNQLRAQDYQVVANDNMEGPPVHDLRQLSVALDAAQDSLWIKISYFDTIGGDFGAAIAFDTNMNVNDGNTWGGANSSMKHDLVIYLERNGFFEDSIRFSSPVVKDLRETDSSVVLNFRWSEISPSGLLHFITGSGGFDISASGIVYDDMPDTGYVTLPLPTTGIEQHASTQLKIYPNPARGFVKLDTKGATGVKLIAFDGRLVRQWNITNETSTLDITGINPGLYTLVSENGSGAFATSTLQIIR